MDIELAARKLRRILELNTPCEDEAKYRFAAITDRNSLWYGALYGRWIVLGRGVVEEICEFLESQTTEHSEVQGEIRNGSR